MEEEGLPDLSVGASGPEKLVVALDGILRTTRVETRTTVVAEVEAELSEEQHGKLEFRHFTIFLQ